jgi:hypothetical protein
MVPKFDCTLSRATAIAVMMCLALGGCSRDTDAVQSGSKAQALFDFRSNFWVNLHHVLYETALRRLPQQDGNIAEPLLKIGVLDYHERSVWDAAVSYYYNEFIIKQRDLLFDADMRRIKSTLAQQSERSDLVRSELPAGLIDVLRRAAVLYEEHWWLEHDRVNRQLAATLAAQVAKYGPSLQQQLIASYHSSWPAGAAQQRLRVDVVYYANWTGAYTFTAPPEITLASREDERSAGWRKLELLFHEASHTLLERLNADIDASAALLGKQPEQLWHATLYFTTGEIVRRTLEKDGISDYVPYAYYNGMFAPDSDWGSYARSLEKYWQPYLAGDAEYSAAIAGLVSALPSQVDSRP